MSDPASIRARLIDLSRHLARLTSEGRVSWTTANQDGYYVGKLGGPNVMIGEDAAARHTLVLFDRHGTEIEHVEQSGAHGELLDLWLVAGQNASRPELALSALEQELGIDPE